MAIKHFSFVRKKIIYESLMLRIIPLLAVWLCIYDFPCLCDFFGKQTPVPPLLRYLVSISPPLLKVSKWKCIVSTWWIEMKFHIFKYWTYSLFFTDSVKNVNTKFFTRFSLFGSRVRINNMGYSHMTGRRFKRRKIYQWWKVAKSHPNI